VLPPRHRPDNILLTATGPLLLDFGAARRVIGDMTHALTVVLKPGYAPIEQYGDVASMTQGAWTDIYALACVVYYAITGKTPMSSVERLMDDRLEPIASRRRAATATASCARSTPRWRCGRRTGRRTRPSSAPCSTSTCRAPPPVAAAERLRRAEPRAVPARPRTAATRPCPAPDPELATQLQPRTGRARRRRRPRRRRSRRLRAHRCPGRPARRPPAASPPAAAVAVPPRRPPRAGRSAAAPRRTATRRAQRALVLGAASLLVVSGLAFGVYWTLQPSETRREAGRAARRRRPPAPLAAVARPLRRRLAVVAPHRPRRGRAGPRPAVAPTAPPAMPPPRRPHPRRRLARPPCRATRRARGRRGRRRAAHAAARAPHAASAARPRRRPRREPPAESRPAPRPRRPGYPPAIAARDRAERRAVQ
jgi:hypothetical protein